MGLIQFRLLLDSRRLPGRTTAGTVVFIWYNHNNLLGKTKLRANREQHRDKRSQRWGENKARTAAGWIKSILSELCREQEGKRLECRLNLRLKEPLFGCLARLRRLNVCVYERECGRIPACWRLRRSSLIGPWCCWPHWKLGTTERTRSSGSPPGSWRNWGQGTDRDTKLKMDISKDSRVTRLSVGVKTRGMRNVLHSHRKIL